MMKRVTGTDWEPFLKKVHGRVVPVIARPIDARITGRCKPQMLNVSYRGWGWQDRESFLRKAVPCDWSADHGTLLARDPGPLIGEFRWPAGGGCLVLTATSAESKGLARSESPAVPPELAAAVAELEAARARYAALYPEYHRLCVSAPFAAVLTYQDGILDPACDVLCAAERGVVAALEAAGLAAAMVRGRLYARKDLDVGGSMFEGAPLIVCDRADVAGLSRETPIGRMRR